MIVAIDGPSGAGKSTVSKLVAERLGFSCLDTGAMYRCVAWRAAQEGVDLGDQAQLGRIAREARIEFVHEPGSIAARAVLVDGCDVTAQIRTAQIDRAVSAVSAVVAVREALVDQQRAIGAGGDFVVEGRDIGTVVFPQAEVKVFLTASNEERARRRVAQNAERGVGSVDFDEVLADIVARDARDEARAASPLVAADDAALIDSTRFSRDEVVARICALAAEKLS
ncbi:(d)CMP kinase [Berryella wangjianweii]|uniref:Cytidylate kinase n=1 Tax=Berryella wangjianweii TaxID=2734634 RepID=A0A6M8IZP9_9ACTN|nr:(d)CMP kinase [Berryella wangjianweii]NPD32466.1 (d)CMP kinase [Eggerthellaceae bacterium zg-997]QKF06777.1 (d)CMP kinase [Berryella wangjianweii]